MGIVPSGHLPFTCHDCVIGFDLSLDSVDTLLSSKTRPSG
ncbi:hypothetical protein OIU79_009487 [Salix purpurea]|uniref:Uncharacterized protein n=1 Tax=Salix purpurea TaxID=77065 RepID=A0A9Q0TKS5_SALPP|nr:hypothetical protein OIU79_009487 [Salix purpurea]